MGTEDGLGDPDSPQRFCEDFASLVRSTGKSLRGLADASGWGKSTIAAAMKGPRLPNSDLIHDVLQVLEVSEEDRGKWKQRHDALADVVAVRTLEADRPAEVNDTKPTSEQTRLPTRDIRASSSIIKWIVVGVGVLVAVVAILLFVITGRHTTRAVLVQNKVAYDASTLVEDRSPSYLGARPVARCANQPGCKIPGTDAWTGTVLDATCQIQGDLVTNANLRTTTLRGNPNVSASTLWYGVESPDGRTGFISEVYVAPSYRGGLGLPSC